MTEAYVDAEGYNSQRVDGMGELGAVLEGLLPWTAANRAFKWSLELRGVNLHSDDPDYSYRQVSLMAGVVYEW